MCTDAEIRPDTPGDVSSKLDKSNIHKDNPSGIEAGHNSKVVDMFKDGASGQIIQDFVGLRAKLYSYKMFAGKKVHGYHEACNREHNNSRQLQGMYIFGK